MNLKPCSDDHECLNIISDPSTKGVTIMTDDQFNQAENRVFRSGFSSLSILDEGLTTFFVGLSFDDFDPYYETFNSKICQLFEAGIISLHHKIYVNPKGIERVAEPIDTQVLSMEHLGVGFLIYLSSLAISFIVFLGEITFSYFKKQYRYML